MVKETAILAGGCFWGVQYYFDQVPGVLETEVGYIGGHSDNPTYEAVCTHTTGHAEAVKITYDPARVIAGAGNSKHKDRADGSAGREDFAFQIILRQFFRMHDPTQLNRQGPDIGDNYRSAIFYTDEAQKTAAEQAINEASGNFTKPIVTTIEPAAHFWPAEDYHQKFTEKTGRGMCHIAYATT
jgi:methionine-S-sulfoxide reductase